MWKTKNKVTKTLVRNCEEKLKSDTQVTFDFDSKLPCNEKNVTEKLSVPSLCSSKIFSNYMNEIKKSISPLTDENRLDSTSVSSKVTKKLNFHFNDTIYKNLVELNTSVAATKNTKKASRFTSKKDMEPNIEDFYEDVKHNDVAPNIPILKQKFKQLRKYDNGTIHRLVDSFEIVD